MKYNLLQKTYDLQCEMFINGLIDFNTFQVLESKYIKIYKLFTIYLN